MNEFFYSFINTDMNIELMLSLCVIFLLLLGCMFGLSMAIVSFFISDDISFNTVVSVGFKVITIISIVSPVFLAIGDSNKTADTLADLKEKNNVNVQLNTYKSFTYNSQTGLNLYEVASFKNENYLIYSEKTDSNDFGGLYIVIPKKYKEDVLSQFGWRGVVSGFLLTLNKDSIDSQLSEQARKFCNCLFITDINELTIEPDTSDKDLKALYKQSHDKHLDKLTGINEEAKENNQTPEQSAQVKAKIKEVELEDALTRQQLVDNWHKDIRVVTTEGEVLDISLEDIKIIKDTRTYLKYEDEVLIEIHYSSSNTSPAERVSVDVNVDVDTSQK